MNNKELALHAYRARKLALTGVHNAASGHPGGSLSIADIMSVLYFDEMNIDTADPKKPDRDRFVLSKGHCAPILYGTLAERGFFPTEEVGNLRKIDSFLQGHPEMKGVPGVDMSTGSLGQGISAACGMALAAKKKGESYRVYTVLGDGECEEGQVWEAAMFAAHYKLDNLMAFVDHNGLQIDGKITDVMSPEPLDEKFRAFGWNVIVIDAHDYDQIKGAITSAKAAKGQPTMVIANSHKGMGVSFMMDNPAWHGAAPNDEQFAEAVAELDKKIAELEA